MSIQLQQKLLEHCVAGTTARAALFVGVQANTPKLILQRVRRLIASTQESYLLAGAIEVDERYLGPVCKGRRGRAQRGKCPFGAYSS